MTSITEMADAMLGLFYPANCPSCGMRLAAKEILCFQCEIKLPKTDFHKQLNNPVEKMFWGRAKIERASALYYFVKDSGVQRLIHSIKYQGNQDLAVHIGKLHGKALSTCELWAKSDIIIPVPLHLKKEKDRGFNQSEKYAEGLGEILDIPVLTDLVVKDKRTETQTKKSRWARWMNVGDSFKINDNRRIRKGMRILIVDDVVTTGATIESLVHAFSEFPEIKFQVATIAFAERN